MLPVSQHVIALASIRAARLKHVGIAPTHERSQRQTVAVPLEAQAQNLEGELSYALSAALDFWPDCKQWEVITCDQISHSDSIPPDFVLMHEPEQSGIFESK